MQVDARAGPSCVCPRRSPCAAAHSALHQPCPAAAPLLHVPLPSPSPSPSPFTPALCSPLSCASAPLQRQSVSSVHHPEQRAAALADVCGPAAAGGAAAARAAQPRDASGENGGWRARGATVGEGCWVSDAPRQVVDKRSNDRCCFDHFVAVVGLCRDVRQMHDAACWIFQKVRRAVRSNGSASAMRLL